MSDHTGVVTAIRCIRCGHNVAEHPESRAQIGGPAGCGWTQGMVRMAAATAEPMCAECAEPSSIARTQGGCWCCRDCGRMLGTCGCHEQRAAAIREQLAVEDAARVLAEHGIDAAKYEALIKLANGIPK